MLSRHEGYSEEFYKTYLNMFLSVFLGATRDLNELRHLVRQFQFLFFLLICNTNTNIILNSDLVLVSVKPVMSKYNLVLIYKIYNC